MRKLRLKSKLYNPENLQGCNIIFIQLKRLSSGPPINLEGQKTCDEIDHVGPDI